MPSHRLISTPELLAAFENGRQAALTDASSMDYFDPRNGTFNRGTILKPVPWGDIAYVALGRDQYQQIEVSEGLTTLAEIAGRIEAVADFAVTRAVMAERNKTPLRPQDRLTGFRHDTVPVSPYIIIEALESKQDGSHG